MSLSPPTCAGSNPRKAPCRHFFRPALHGAAPNTMMSAITGPTTLTLSRSRPCSSLTLSPSTGFGPNITGSGGHSSSLSLPIRDRALLIPAKNVCPESQPACQSRGRLRTFAAAALQACRCSSVSTRLHAFEIAPNAPRARPRPAVRTFLGITYLRRHSFLPRI